MYPGAIAEQHPDRVAVVMATGGEAITYAELDEEANRLSHVFRAPACSRATTWPSCLENQPRFLAVVWGAHYAGPLLHGDELPAHHRGDGLHHRRLRRAGVHHLGLQGRAGRRARRPDAGGELRLMLDGVIDGFEPYEDAVAAPAGHAARRGAGRGPGHALQLGHHRAAQGREGAAARTRRWARAPTASPAWRSCCSAPTSRPSTSPPPRCTTRRRCASAERPTASAAPWS